MTARKQKAQTAVTATQVRAWAMDESNALPEGVNRPKQTRGRLSDAVKAHYEKVTGNVILRPGTEVPSEPTE